MARQPGLFDLDERYAALSAAGDPLKRLGAVVDFELFTYEGFDAHANAVSALRDEPM